MTDILLGHDTQTNKEVRIWEEQRLTGMYMIGANGTGKSTMLEQMIVQDIAAPERIGVCLLDPHGDLTASVLNRIPEKRLQDVILLDPLDTDYPFGLNLFACADPADPKLAEHTVNQIVQVFEKVFGMSRETPRLNQFVRNIAYTLLGTPYTMAEIPNLLLDSSFRARVVANVSSNSTRLFWRSYDSLRNQEQLDRSESTLDRIDSLISNSILRNITGQSHTTIDFRDIMDSGKILLVQLAARYESLTSLLGSIIIGQLLTAALSRAGTKSRRQFNLYADEYQRFATPDFATLLTEARKFGVATTIAHQVRAQLDEKNAATALQAGSLVVFRVTPEDAEDLAPAFDLTPTPADEREKTIPSDILMHLTDHPNEYVKEFERQHVRKFLQAKVLHTGKEKSEYYPRGSKIYEPIETEHPVYPEFIFDDEKIKFDPDELLKFLEMMETFLYNTIFQQQVDMDQFNKVMVQWGFCCSGMFLPSDGKLHYRLKETGYAPHDQWLEGLKKQCAVRYERFKEAFLRIAFILKHEPIRVFPSTRPQENTSQQTYADRRNQRANELVGLPRGTARVKLPDSEYLIKTIPSTTPFTDQYGKKRIQVIEQTRRQYCTPRHEVEEQIRQRQSGDNSTTKRRGI